LLRVESTNGVHFVLKDPGFNWNAGKQAEELHILLLMAYMKKMPVLLVGPTGVGKTLAAEQLAFDMSNENAKKEVPVPHMTPVPLIRYQCSKESGHYDMCGHEVIGKDGSVVFAEGALPLAIRLANERGTAILLIDEINAISPEGQKALNPLLEEKRRVILGSREWALDDNAALIIIATMNAPRSGYGGVGKLNADLERRFGLKAVLGYPGDAEERNVLSQFTGDRALVEKLVLLARHTREGANPGSETKLYNTPLSTADLRNFIMAYQNGLDMLEDGNYAMKLAFDSTILPMFRMNREPEDAMRKKIMDIFNVNVADDRLPQ